VFYYLFEHLKGIMHGAGLFQYLSFRASLAIIISLLISLVLGGRFIKALQNMQVRETVRDLGLAGEQKKKGTPTMGGLIILAAILIPTVLLARLDNVYIWLLLIVTVWTASIGFVDDYIKIFKQDKKGLRAQFKIIGQVGIGIIVGTVMYFHPDVIIREDVTYMPDKQFYWETKRFKAEKEGVLHTLVDFKAPITNVPFLKNYELDYGLTLSFLGEGYQKWAFLIYIPVIIFIITAVSNAANLTDGIDGLATGLSAIAGIALGLFAYFSGNSVLADYLNIMYLPNIGELLVFTAAFIGACIGFLWYNAHPAQVFMGDTGSLMLGGIIATIAIAVRKELLIPVLCGMFLVESLSVMLQVGYFKYTRKKYGEGRRIFLMSPLHHHYQKKGIHESKIVTRFWIIGILLAVLSIVTLKIR